MTTKVKESAKVREALEKVVFLDVEVTSGEGKRLAEAHNIRTYPTYLLLNADETVIHSWYGFFGSVDWAKTFDAVLTQ